MEIGRVFLFFLSFSITRLHIYASRIALVTGLDHLAMACFLVSSGGGVRFQHGRDDTYIPFLLNSHSYTDTQQQPNHSRFGFRGGEG